MSSRAAAASLPEQVDLQIGAAGREGIAVDAPADIEAGKDPVLAAAAVARHADRADGDADIVARPAVTGIVILLAGCGRQYIVVDLAVLQEGGRRGRSGERGFGNEWVSNVTF